MSFEPIRRALIAGSLGLCVVHGCVGEPHRDTHAPGSGATIGEVRYQASPWEEEGALFVGHPIGAALTRDGQWLAVLDAHPPFVKVVDKEGSVRSAFLPKGSGPGESLLPVSLTWLPDEVLLVTDVRGRAFYFRRDGTLLIEGRLPRFPIVKMAPDCRGNPVMYHPGIRNRTPPAIIRSTYQDGEPPHFRQWDLDLRPDESIGIGKPYAAFSDSTETLFRHGRQGRFTIRVPCDRRREPQVNLMGGNEALSREDRAWSPNRDWLSGAVPWGASTPAGIARIGGSILHVDARIRPGNELQYEAVLFAPDGSVLARSSLPIMGMLHDLSPAGFLMSDGVNLILFSFGDILRPLVEAYGGSRG